MNNIQRAISPLLVVLCLCGFGVFEYPHGRPRLYLTILYILISWLLYIYGIVETQTFLNEFSVDLNRITKVSVIFSVLIIPLSLYCNKRFRSGLKKLTIVNDTLEKLGMPKDYTVLRIQVTWLLIGWIVFIFFMNVLDSMWLLKQIPIAITICLSFIMNQSLYVSMLSDVFHIILLRYIGSRFEQINQHIEKLTERRKRQVGYIWTTSSVSLVRRYITGIETPKQIISTLMHVHLELCLVTHQLTTVCGMHMVMQTIALNISMAQLAIDLYVTIMLSDIESLYRMESNTFVTCIWITINGMKMVIFNCVCEQVCSKAKQTEIFLNRFGTYILDIETHEYIMQFLFQLSYQPLQISGFGFHFGYKFLEKCMNYIGMIIIITGRLRGPEM